MKLYKGKLFDIFDHSQWEEDDLKKEESWCMAILVSSINELLKKEK